MQAFQAVIGSPFPQSGNLPVIGSDNGNVRFKVAAVFHFVLIG